MMFVLAGGVLVRQRLHGGRPEAAGLHIPLAARLPFRPDPAAELAVQERADGGGAGLAPGPLGELGPSGPNPLSAPVLGSWVKPTRDAVRNKEWWKRRDAPTLDFSTSRNFSPCPVQSALLTPRVNPGSRYRCGKSAVSAACAMRLEGRGLNPAPQNNVTDV